MAEKSELDSPLEGRQLEALLINAVTDYAIYMLDAQGRVATWNPGARRFKGYEAEEIIGQHFSRFYTEEDRAAGVPERALRTAAEEGRFEAEGERVRKNGERFWAHVLIDPIRAEDGSLIGYAKVTRDISEQRKARQELFEAEQRFRMLVQGVRDYAIYMLDTEGRITNWNAGAEAIKGYTADEIVGQHFSRFYTEEDRAAGEPARALETARTEGKYEREAWRVRKDGSRFWASVLLDPIYDEAGELAGYAKVTRDITEKRNAQLELEEARAALFQAQKLQALGELTGGIAHDFNNLITVIRGSAELLERDGIAPAKRKRHLRAIVETAERAASLTSHLLAFGRRQTLKPQVIDVRLALDAFVEIISRTLGSPIEIGLDLAPDLWPIEADPTVLESALLNAAINARDAMPEGGRLTVSACNHADDLVCIALADTGEGMAPETLERAFEPFFTTKGVGRGTGLGLSQIHGFAAQTGGRCEIESEEGKGTTLRLYLPRSHEAPRAAEAAPADRPSLAGVRVLLVEDNDHVREFAEQLLEDLGCEVVTTDSADAAMAALGSESVDIVFSDIVMPGASGIELARRLAEARPELPVLLATGYSEDVFAGAANGFEVLRKPYGAASLAGALASALRRCGGGTAP